MRLSSAKFVLALLAVAFVAPDCPAPDSIALRILYATGTRVALEDPLTFNAGTIRQGLEALGYTDPTPYQLRSATDNRAFPATLESLTVPSWPLLPGLTSKSMVAKPDDATLIRRLGPGLTSEGEVFLSQRVGYSPPIQEPDFVKPEMQQSYRLPGEKERRLALLADRPKPLTREEAIWTKPERPHIEVPRHERPQYDYSGPPFLFTAPPEFLKNPIIAKDPSLVRLFVKTNDVGARDSLSVMHAARPVRRMRPASYWDSVEAPNNPRADYDTASEYETQARNNSRGLVEARDPNNEAGVNDRRPSYNVRPSYNPYGRSILSGQNR